jgi:hypothetical protein
MDLLDVLDKIVRGRSAAQAAFTIAPDHVLDGQEEGEEIFLKPQATYFEIRLKQMHLRDQREYWRSFRPFATFVSSFLHAGQKREVPFVVGPEMLDEAVKLQDGDRVEYLNTRVAGPFPYEGMICASSSAWRAWRSTIGLNAPWVCWKYSPKRSIPAS